MKKFTKITVRIATIVCSILVFNPLVKWFEDINTSRQMAWWSMDNQMGYNKPIDWGPWLSYLIAIFLISLLIMFVWGSTADDQKQQ